ncbi:NADP-dependent phosphogluconate dehydrogenase [Salinivibrio sp. ML290]|uniref:NADP-dependent phosphogluconate dehydrogenase n=1 Tax=Salinivibrio sp. ML290 TaxID=1909468 RepID=UPI0009884738|nr:NADP-dependent phosphogluconate dehydrogenase [Salinivibrio sp. ML290]OOE74285.1 phosphogluconate dehydrogenase (NADP(+)-dependent, decarboxylating) [Salinivibrio sp. ML290]
MMPSQISLVGLGVMGKSLALNLVDHGFNVAGFDIDPHHRQAAREAALPLNQVSGKGQLTVVDSLSQLLASLQTPRVIALSVPAGEVVDQVIDELLAAGLAPDDIVIDTGNSLWTDSERRAHDYQGQLRFFNTAISGGEVGARTGPSLMASGDASAWAQVKPMWLAIAAKVDHAGQPVGQFEQGEPCAAYLGGAGVGHYVKMVHNGIEYADMQLIVEAYHFMSQALGMSAVEIGQCFARWNQGPLNSYLMAISAEILQTPDPITGKPFVEVVLDKAGQKGTGMWTAVNALQTGVAAPTIAQAVFARAQSGLKAVRVAAAKTRTNSAAVAYDDIDTQLENLHDALYCAKLSVYAQGFDLINTTAQQQGWTLDFAQIAKIWRAGCIIRAQCLSEIAGAYQQTPDVANLLLVAPFAEAMSRQAPGWRATVASAAQAAVPIPAMAASLSYFDALHSEVLPANLLQAQRDYFGAHGYARVDDDGSRQYHLTWSEQPKRQQTR